MKLAVSMYSVIKEEKSGKIDIPGFVELVHKQGVQGVELLDYSWKDKKTELPATRDLLARKQMGVVYAIANDFAKLESEQRNAQVAYVKEGIADAAELGATVLRVFCGDRKEGVSFEQGLDWIIECFGECAIYAKQKGITMALENHGYFAGRSEQVKQIINAVDSKNLRATIDTGNFFLVGEKPTQAAENLQEYCAHIHFKDFKRALEGQGYRAVNGDFYEGCVLGAGDVEMNAIANMFRDRGYTGYFAIESELTSNQIPGLLESIAFAQSILK